MYKRNKIVSKVNESKDKNWLNVFFVTSPIVAIISKMIIDYFKIHPDNILIVSLRNTDLSILKHEFIKINPGKYDRYLEKLFFYSPSGDKIVRKIHHRNKNFLVFASLAYREVNWVLNSRKSQGHIYIEEGQHSYMNIMPHTHSKLSLYTRFKINWKNRFSEQDEIGYYYRDDAHGYIGIMQDTYPQIPIQDKHILNNLEGLKKYYKPKLLGVNTIGVTCASRRINKNKLEEMLEKLLFKLPSGSVVKPHPSFTTNDKIFDDFMERFNKISKGRVGLCLNNTILEMEMLFEQKKLIGPTSSLSKYADFLGSSYEYVKLY